MLKYLYNFIFINYLFMFNFIIKRCNSIICTPLSNFCRLVDEMRATVGGKANQLFADVNYETCPVLPCVDKDALNYVKDQKYKSMITTGVLW